MSKTTINAPREVGDNFLALAIVIFSGSLTIFALYHEVNDDRAKSALATGAAGMSGVIGFIGGKARRSYLDKEEVVYTEEDGELANRLAYLEDQLGVSKES